LKFCPALIFVPCAALLFVYLPCEALLFGILVFLANFREKHVPMYFLPKFYSKGNGLNFIDNFLHEIIYFLEPKKWASAMFQVLNVEVACPPLLLNIEKWPKNWVFLNSNRQSKTKSV
jgi:hypothetical protein